MSYDTRYSLGIYGADTDASENMLIDEVTDASGYSNPFGESITWYDHEDDLKTVSSMHPNVIFKLHGEGAESGDIWNKYFKAGKMQECPARIVYDEFDESKLN